MVVSPPAVTLHFSPLPPPQCLKQQHRQAVGGAKPGLHGDKEEWLATGLAVCSPGWVVSDHPAIGGAGSKGSSASHHEPSSAADQLSWPVGVTWDKRRGDALHIFGRDFSSLSTARIGDVVAAGVDSDGDSEVTKVSSNVTLHRMQRYAATGSRTGTALTCARVVVCPPRGLMLGASLQPPELHLSSFSPDKQTLGSAATTIPLPSAPEEIALSAEGDLVVAVGGGVLAVYRTSGGEKEKGRGTGSASDGALAIEQLGSMRMTSNGKVLRCKFITSRRGRVAVLLVQAGENEGVSASSMMVECVDSVSSSSVFASGEGDGAGGFRLVARSSAKMKMVNVNAAPAGVASSATAAEWDEYGREVVLGVSSGALSVHPRGRPDNGDEGQVVPTLRTGRIPGGGTPTLLRWGRVGGDAVLAVAIQGGQVAMMLPSLQPLSLVLAPSTSPEYLRRVFMSNVTPETDSGAALAAMVTGAEGRVAQVTPRVSTMDERNHRGDDDIAFIEWDGACGCVGGAWGRMAVVMSSGCAAVIDVAPDAPAAACGESRGALGLASAARDLPTLEDLMVGIMRRGPGACGRAAGDPIAAAMVLTAAAAAAWRIVSTSSSSVGIRDGTVALIRRVVQWRAARGELEGAYSLAHMTGDRATLEDVYCAALRQGSSGVMTAARDRLAEIFDTLSLEKPSHSSILPSTEELSRLTALETHNVSAALSMTSK